MSIIAAVEEEFGEPFWSVVSGFARDGYGCDTTARILGYSSPRGLRRLIQRHGVSVPWPQQGRCLVQQNRQPLSAETRKKISEAKQRGQDTIAAAYESRTGEPAEQAIKRLARRHTLSEVARLIGWKTPQPMAHWLRVRDISVEFVKRAPTPPRHDMRTRL